MEKLIDKIKSKFLKVKILSKVKYELPAKLTEDYFETELKKRQQNEK